MIYNNFEITPLWHRTDLLIYVVFFATRYDSSSGGEREIQRTMLELLTQLDGFDARGEVKVFSFRLFFCFFFLFFFTIVIHVFIFVVMANNNSRET